MRTSSRMQKGSVLFLGLSIFLAGAGCQKIKALFTKPSSEEVTVTSSALRLYGYEETVTINAPPAEVQEYLGDPGRIQLSVIKIGSRESRQVFGNWPDELGSGFEVKVQMAGVGFEGKLFMVKYDGENYWTIIDNPLSFNTQRWILAPAPEGSHLTIRLAYEVLETLGPLRIGDLVDLSPIMDSLLAELDEGLAVVQAHFNPTLVPKELTAHGLRGHAYESMAQVYEAEVWVDARPEEVMAWAMAPENFAAVMGGIVKVEEEIVERYGRSPDGAIIHAPGHFQWGVISAPVDLFMVRHKDRNRVYLVVMDLIALLDAQFESRAGGTIVRSRIVVEMPEASSPALMDIFFLIAGVPEVMERSLLILKEGVEGGKVN